MLIEQSDQLELATNESILAVCKALLEEASLDECESSLLADIRPAPATTIAIVKELVHGGADPLGDAYMRLNSVADRRSSGAVYTPSNIVDSMVGWSSSQIAPARVVDCGCGSGRFALAAARAFPDARVVAVDVSPMATVMCKANAAALGVSIAVMRDDFTLVALPFEGCGPTLWIGNPPYVRHHGLSKDQKRRYLDSLRELGVGGSALAGLHSHFVASIAQRFGRGDVGCLIMSAEWMDVGYGTAIREILSKRLPMTYLNMFSKTSETFAGTMSSAVVVGFADRRQGGRVRVNGSDVDMSAFESSTRWSDVVSGRVVAVGEGYVRLGDIARVHRGVVTGRNSFWVRQPGEVSEQLSVPVVSHARELTGSNPACRNVASLRRLVTLPEDLSTLSQDLYTEAQGIIREGLRDGVDGGFVASHRRSWWSIKAPKAPAIMMTYMSRNAPTFVVNNDGLGMLNVVHGIYPTVSLSPRAISNLAKYLNQNVTASDGRIYAGGLSKFEPREVERIMIPSVEVLEESR